MRANHISFGGVKIKENRVTSFLGAPAVQYALSCLASRLQSAASFAVTCSDLSAGYQQTSDCAHSCS